MPPLSSFPPAQPSASTSRSTRQGNRRGRRGHVALVTVAAVTLALVGASGSAVAHGGVRGHHGHNAFKQVNLVSDIPGLAQLTDSDVVNPWGIDFGRGQSATPLWVSNQGSNTLTLYRGATKASPMVEKLGLVIKANSPTGMVFNTTKKFVITQGGKKAPANFLMNENVFNADQTDATAQVTAWSAASAPPPPTTTVVKASVEHSTYAGLTLVPATHRRGPRLLAVNDSLGRIDVYNGKFRLLHRAPNAFVDPRAEADGLAPYNAAYLRGRVYVAYFGETNSGLSVFKTNGTFVKRLATNGADGPLVAPWGMTIAPKHWGHFGGALLVGNVGDGQINAFNARNGHHLGVLRDAKGAPLVNIGLWGLTFGNGVMGNRNTLLFAAGIGETPTDFGHFYGHGLIGAITPVHHRHRGHH
jgi:uncharacterized protein (TIGR03118 family)